MGTAAAMIPSAWKCMKPLGSHKVLGPHYALPTAGTDSPSADKALGPGYILCTASCHAYVIWQEAQLYGSCIRSSHAFTCM